MTCAEDLLQALNALRHAATAELSGEAKDAALLQIKDLFRLADFSGEDSGEGTSGAILTLAEAIAAVRTQAEGELAGSAFQSASKILDGLGIQSPLPQTPSEDPVAKPADGSETPPPSRPTMSELAAASMARVEEVARLSGIGGVHQRSPIFSEHHHDDDAEHHNDLPEHPTASVESAPPAPAPVEAAETESSDASVIAEYVEVAASAREVAEATHDFGTPAVQAAPVADYGAHWQKPTASKAEPRTASSAHETPPDEVVEHPEKIYFRLWLDMLLGRRK